MSFLHRLFQFGHLVISVLFLVAGFALIGTAAIQVWQGIQPLESATLPIQQGSRPRLVHPRSSSTPTIGIAEPAPVAEPNRDRAAS